MQSYPLPDKGIKPKPGFKLLAILSIPFLIVLTLFVFVFGDVDRHVAN